MNNQKDEIPTEITTGDDQEKTIRDNIGKNDVEEPLGLINKLQIEYVPFDDERKVAVESFLKDIYMRLQAIKRLQDDYMQSLEADFSRLISINENASENSEYRGSWMENLLALFVAIENYDEFLKNKKELKHQKSLRDSPPLLAVQSEPNESPWYKFICEVLRAC